MFSMSAPAHAITNWGVVRISRRRSFSVRRGETLGVVGESGSKSVTCSCLKLERYEVLNGRNLLDLRE